MFSYIYIYIPVFNKYLYLVCVYIYMISISLISVFSTLQVKIAQMFSFNLNFFAPECSAETPYITKWIGYLVPCARICKNESVIVELHTTAKWSKTRPWRIMESNDWLIRHTCFGQKRERKKNPHGFFHSGHPIFHDHALKRCLCYGLHLHPSRLGTRGALKPGSVWNGASLAGRLGPVTMSRPKQPKGNSWPTLGHDVFVWFYWPCYSAAREIPRWSTGSWS